MSSRLRLLLCLLAALCAVGLGMRGGKVERAKAVRSCCASTQDSGGGPHVCHCGNVEGECCCSKRRVAAQAGCSASCDCGRLATGSAPLEDPDESPALIEIYPVLLTMEAVAELSDPVWTSDYESPRRGIEPPPPRPARRADIGREPSAGVVRSAA